MSESLRRTDDGTEARPYGRHSVCASCKFGRVQVTCKHEWRSRLDKSPDFDEETGPIRTYHLYAVCLHPDMFQTADNATIHPTMLDQVRCELWEGRL